MSYGAWTNAQILCQLHSWIVLALTPGQIFAFTSDQTKIRPGIDCMLSKRAALFDKQDSWSCTLSFINF